MRLAFQPVLELSEQSEIETLVRPALEKENHTNQKEKKDTMKIAIPTTNGKLSSHFGHCEEFALVDVNEQTKEIVNVTKLQPPAHEPGVLPKWLSEQKADVIIAGGMGQRAQQLFAQNNIKVIVGAPEQPVEELALAFIDNTLKIGDNVCDH
jgi:predicted Fe-Mo cluster-binding NifX family protein